MIDCEKLIMQQIEIGHFCVKITQSPNDDYDYQFNINKIIKDNNKDQLLDFLLNDNSLTEIFDICSENIGNSHFVCFKIKQNVLMQLLKQSFDSDFTYIQKCEFLDQKTILYDYSSPNMAKDMHVGHLRSTIIGDTLANVSQLLGHNVIRINHIGDFGLPFGMILEYVISQNIVVNESTNLQEIYVLSKKLFESNDDFKNKSYLRTTDLQTCDQHSQTHTCWNNILENSSKQYQKIYNLLNISSNLKIMGESYYVKYINEVKNMLTNNNLLETDDKNLSVINVPNMHPLIWEKSEERGSGYTYDTTDLVTVWYRTQYLNVDEIYYVVDDRQESHFNQIFTIANMMGWSHDKKLMHVKFGTILDQNGKPLKARDGNAPKLLDLIEDSINKTTEQFEKKNQNTQDYKKEINAIAIGSLKYQDFSKCRTSNYKFDFDRMLKFEGNTYTYLSYTVARIRGLFDNVTKHNILLNSQVINEQEFTENDFKLIRKIFQFASIINSIEKTKMINFLPEYLHKLSSLFHCEYAKCRYFNFDNDGNFLNCNKTKLILCKILLNIFEISCSIMNIDIVNKL